MELKRDEIVKALDCFRHRILHSKLAEKVTESEMMSIIDAIDLIKELTEENERLRANAKSATEILNFKFAYDAGKADTARKMQERLRAETIVIKDHTGKLGSVVTIGTIEQIAKEIMNEDNI